eukprot:941442-Pleurochrysis_carterae.AAC.2
MEVAARREESGASALNAGSSGGGSRLAARSTWSMRRCADTRDWQAEASDEAKLKSSWSRRCARARDASAAA